MSKAHRQALKKGEPKKSCDQPNKEPPNTTVTEVDGPSLIYSNKKSIYFFIYFNIIAKKMEHPRGA